ncbi:MAG: hypothetical protein ACP5PQ_03740 [Thermoproteota archaeon]
MEVAYDCFLAKTVIPRNTPNEPPVEEIVKNHFSGILVSPLIALALSTPMRMKLAMLTSRR